MTARLCETARAPIEHLHAIGKGVNLRATWGMSGRYSFKLRRNLVSYRRSDGLRYTGLITGTGTWL